ncbi:MAG: NAD-dependent DNA ligase LigA [Taibaiella sp.]|nr:NAD-dependent DNA ligase LigA [Taibaiella sp.]
MYTTKDEQHLYQQAKALLDNKNDDVSVITTLRGVINYADWKYYVQDEPVLADAEYDTLYKKLKHLEEEFPEQQTADSPTQRIAKGLSEKFPPVSHLVPMLSLDNTYNAEDLRDWDKRCHDYLDENTLIEYCVEPKYDGASISLVYDHDQLARGATRGDGIMGEEITTNIRQIRSIPLSAPFSSKGVEQTEIRGEVVIHKKTFTAFNEQRSAEGLAPLANPRNAASGTLRMLDPTEVRKRGLTAILYHISYYTLTSSHKRPKELATHYDSIQWLYQLGFPTPAKEMKVFTDINDVIAYCGEFEQRRDELPFEVDGLVIKVNSFDMQDRMGMTTHHPRWAVAYKFKARQATSRLLRVEFQVGRTGTITPVAKIDPVPIGGVTVTSVSLFNEDVIREKDLYIGDTILVERAGDVIPYIVKPLAELRTGKEEKIIFPAHCPACNEPLVKVPDEAALRCVNINCPAQVVERIMHFASKDAMDIRNLGGANILKFYELGLLNDIPGIYTINWEEIKKMDGFGAKSITNLQQAITNSKQQPLSRLIFGLGIRFVGETTAKTLAHAVAHISELYDWDTTRLATLEDIGPKVAASVVSFFQEKANRETINELEEQGVNLANHHRGGQATTGELTGKTFLFTGTMQQLKRSDAETMVEEKGGTILNGVSSKLHYLVVGEDAGSKLEKAKKLGTISIITEEEFLKMIGS